MSKLSVFIHDHAAVFTEGTEILGAALAVLPIPAVAKDPLLGVLAEMNKTAQGMGDSATQVEANLLADLLGGAASTFDPAPVAASASAGLTSVQNMAATAAATRTALATPPAGGTSAEALAQAEAEGGTAQVQTQVPPPPPTPPADAGAGASMEKVIPPTPAGPV